MCKGNSKYFFGTLGYKKQLIQELKDKGIKFSEQDLLFITKDKTGQIIWLETGNSTSGLKHILDGNGITTGHANDFQKAFGISKSEVASYIEKVVTNGTIINNHLKKIGKRTGYERTYYYNDNYYIVTGIGTNGYIVSAYPKRIKK